jgi:hypothetical protein
MKIGFTGTRRGMAQAQNASFWYWLAGEGEFHHGDCTGSDEQAHIMARGSMFRIVVHPPTDDKNRAFCIGDETRDPLPYLDRNRNIVDETEVLVATPAEDEEQLRSGTWSTIRYARKQGKRVVIIYPDGRVAEDRT